MLLSSRPPSPPPDDHASQLEEFVHTLISQREAVGSELDVLRSIYGDHNIRVWTIPTSRASSSADDDADDTAILRYEIKTNLPSHEDIHFQILVSLPPTYPQTSPPQLQILSRYIGAFGVDSGLFGDILKTYISSQSKVEFVPDTVAVFDGLQNAIDLCNSWYEERLSAGTAGELIREDERSSKLTTVMDPPLSHNQAVTIRTDKIPIAIDPVSIPELVEAEPIIDRKSIFIGRACKISHPSQVHQVLAYLLSNKHVARAAHPTINAWRCSLNGVMHQDNDDDGETAAGGRLAHLLQILDLNGVLVIVTRFFGGIHLGPDRFKHINQAARSALEKGRFLDEPDELQGQNRKKSGKKR